MDYLHAGLLALRDFSTQLRQRAPFTPMKRVFGAKLWVVGAIKNLTGRRLTKDGLSGALTKLAAYRGTSCKVDVAEYAIRRINGQQTPESERALAALEKLKGTVVDLLKLLGWRTISETLVDLLFSTSGWRRQGPVGNTQKTKDIEILLPSTNELAFVQVKSATTPSEFAEYVQALNDGKYDRLFYVYHTCSGPPITTEDDRVTVIGPERVATMIIDAGLVNWLIERVE